MRAWDAWANLAQARQPFLDLRGCRLAYCACRGKRTAFAPAGEFCSMAMSSTASHSQSHLSPVLQGDHDSSIPFLLPLIFAFNSGFINGVLNFGESVSFSLQWNMARYLGFLGPGTTFAKGVLFSQVWALSEAFCAFLSAKSVRTLLPSSIVFCPLRTALHRRNYVSVYVS